MDLSMTNNNNNNYRTNTTNNNSSSRTAGRTTTTSRRSRSYDPVILKSETSQSSISAPHKRTRSTRSSSPSKYRERSRSKDITSRSKSSSSKIIKDGKNNKKEEKNARLKLNRDMTVLADGINLDDNSRLMLAAYDARTLDDFYLMADTDFRDLIQKARITNHSLPPLQIRKIRKLRRWLKEIIDENMEEQLHYQNTMDGDQSTSCRRSRASTCNTYDNKHDKNNNKQQLVPKDWKEQYKNDLPFMKMQLRQQGDSIFERLENLTNRFGCGVGLFQM